MKRVCILILTILCSVMSYMSVAEVITADIAKETADKFLSLDKEWHYATDAHVQLIENNGVAAYYIVQYKAGGWAIVSAQSSSSPIIGYNTTGEFSAPAPVNELLDFNAKIITARAQELGNVEHMGWSRVKQRKAMAQHNNTPDIAPLITVNLNQSLPFNLACPLVDGFSSATGCVAVGMAQAMMVQNYPPRPYGSNSYMCPNSGINSIDYDAEAAYDWEAMHNFEESGNYSEIARFLHHIGVAVNMEYGLAGSGADTQKIAGALTKHFGYSNKTIYYTAKCPDNDEWLELILNELVHGRAVIYSGASERLGHCWNIDGWNQSTQMVHCNWGWSGMGNGYFSLDNMTDEYQGVSFLYDHGAILGVVAPTPAPFEILLHNTQFAIGTEAGTALTYVETISTDSSASYTYELSGREGASTPYQIIDNQLVTTETIDDSDKFKYVRIKSTNVTTGESFEKEFTIVTTVASTSKLLGIYDAHAQSMFKDRGDQEWQVTITADRHDPNKVWLRPICMFSTLIAESISPVYAIYNETDNTLTLPLGQVVFQNARNKMIIGTSVDNTDITTSGDLVLPITQDEDGLKIAFAEEYVFGVGNINTNKWWYQALYDITFTQKSYTKTTPYDIALSETTFAIGQVANVKLADITIACDDRTATFCYEVFDREGNASPYQVVENTLVSSETISDSETFKYLRIKATNAFTGESYEEEFEIDIVENMSGTLVGTYSAYAHSAIPGNPNEAWQITITADNERPNMVWIDPILLFADFKDADISPVYAYYDYTTATLKLPLGQMVLEQKGYYQFIIGATNDTQTIDSNGSIDLQVIQNEGETEILFDPSYIIGIGNAIGNSWWYQGLHHIAYSKKTTAEIEVDGIYYNITDPDAKCVEVTYKGNSYYEEKDEYSGSVVIPSTIAIEGTTYNVTSIDAYAFAMCNELTDITIPESITYIDKYAFASCRGLSAIRIEATIPAEICETTFIEVDKSIALSVPVGCVDTYKAAEYWSEFTNIQDFSGIEDVVSDNNIKVSTHNGTIVINGTAADTVVDIYSMSGVLMHRTTAHHTAGITLPRGIYLVQVEGTTHKVVI